MRLFRLPSPPARPSRGLHYFDTPTIEEIVLASDGKIFRTTSATTLATTGGTVSSGAVDVNFSQFNNKAFLHRWGKFLAVYRWHKLVSARYKRAFDYCQLTEGLGYTGSTATVTVGAPNLALRHYALPPQQLWWQIKFCHYVTVAGSGYTIRTDSHHTPAAGGSGAYGNCQQYTALAPTGLKLIRQFTNRLFAVGTGTDRNTLYASDLLDPEVWKTTNSIVVGGDDGQDIVATITLL